MKSAIILATTALLAASTSQSKVSFRCSDFKKQPDGAWMVVRTTPITITNFERRTQNSFPAYEGARFPPDSNPAPPAKDDVMSALTAEMWEGVDLVSELNKRCR